ncbi:hypothetical protein K502DRAFT_365634 [Neoconidiobolus thromboides FSU 785]|nr:hypothetical protein K502DRAFT_365634 [Neoconidiobolus thromboides FSU 785]
MNSKTENNDRTSNQSYNGFEDYINHRFGSENLLETLESDRNQNNFQYNSEVQSLKQHQSLQQDITELREMHGNAVYHRYYNKETPNSNYNGYEDYINHRFNYENIGALEIIQDDIQHNSEAQNLKQHQNLQQDVSELRELYGDAICQRHNAN